MVPVLGSLQALIFDALKAAKYRHLIFSKIKIFQMFVLFDDYQGRSRCLDRWSNVFNPFINCPGKIQRGPRAIGKPLFSIF